VNWGSNKCKLAATNGHSAWRNPAARQDWFWLFFLCTNGPRLGCPAHTLLELMLLVGSCTLHVARWLVDTILPAPLEAAAADVVATALLFGVC